MIQLPVPDPQKVENANFKDLTPKGHKMDDLGAIFRRKNVARAIVFGSVARRRDTRKSDLDLLIVYETPKRFFDRFPEFDEIFEVLKGKAVDLLIYTPEELQSMADRPFIRRILAEGRIIYER